MRIRKEHIAIIKQAMRDGLNNQKTHCRRTLSRLLSDYKEGVICKDPVHRAGADLVRMGMPAGAWSRFVADTLNRCYPYLQDSHIKTALKYSVLELLEEFEAIQPAQIELTN